MADAGIHVDIRSQAGHAVRNAARELLFDYTRWLQGQGWTPHAGDVQPSKLAEAGIAVDRYLEEVRRG